MKLALQPEYMGRRASLTAADSACRGHRRAAEAHRRSGRADARVGRPGGSVGLAASASDHLEHQFVGRQKARLERGE